MVTKYIGGDVHVATTDLAVERNSRIVARYSVPTTIPSLRAVLSQIAHPKVLVIEEGCMSGWLYRNLRENVDQMIVCDPRRNLYIAQDGAENLPPQHPDAMSLPRRPHLLRIVTCSNIAAWEGGCKLTGREIPCKFVAKPQQNDRDPSSPAASS